MKKFDKILILILLIIAATSGLIIKYNSSKKYDKKYAEIKVKGEIYKEVILDKSKPKETMTIKTDLGENVIEMANGGIRVVDADCPDRLCVKDGYKYNPGEVIVCLPHQVVIEIKGENNKSDVDIISQ